MRFIPIVAAVTIGLFATAAVAQNTSDPNSAPGVSSTGGKPMGAVNKASTADPNSTPSSATTGMAKKHAKKKHHHSM